MPREEKKNEILRAAIRCIDRYGIEKTNAQVIADYMGIAQSSVFYYFPKQEMLFDSLINYIVVVNHQLVEEIKMGASPTTKLETLRLHIKGNLRWAEKHRDQVSALLYSASKTSHNEHMHLTVDKIMKVGEQRILEYLEAGVERKEFKVRMQTKAASKSLHSALVGAIIRSFIEGPDHALHYSEQLLCLLDSIVDN